MSGKHLMTPAILLFMTQMVKAHQSHFKCPHLSSSCMAAESSGADQMGARAHPFAHLV